MVYKIFLIFGVVFNSFSSDLQVQQVDDFIKNLFTQEVVFSETQQEVRMINGYKIQAIHKIKNLFEATIEFSVIAVKKRDEKSGKLKEAVLKQARKETMKYRFVLKDEKLMLAEVPHLFSYSLKLE